MDGGSTWGSAIKIVGDDGSDGNDGNDGSDAAADGFIGRSMFAIFRHSTTKPSNPVWTNFAVNADGTLSGLPSGWLAAPDNTNTNPVWMALYALVGTSRTLTFQGVRQLPDAIPGTGVSYAGTAAAFNAVTKTTGATIIVTASITSGLTGTVGSDGSTAKTSASVNDLFRYNGSNWQFMGTLFMGGDGLSESELGDIRDAILDWRGGYDPSANTAISPKLLDIYTGESTPVLVTDAWDSTNNYLNLLSSGGTRYGARIQSPVLQPTNMRFAFKFRQTSPGDWSGLNLMLATDSAPRERLHDYTKGIVVSFQRPAANEGGDANNPRQWRILFRSANTDSNNAGTVLAGSWSVESDLSGTNITSATQDDNWASQLNFIWTTVSWGVGSTNTVFDVSIEVRGNLYTFYSNGKKVATFTVTANSDWPFSRSTTDGTYADSTKVGTYYGIQSNGLTADTQALLLFQLQQLNSYIELLPESVYAIMKAQVSGDMVTFDDSLLSIVTRSFATEGEAQGGTDTDAIMTPERTTDFWNNKVWTGTQAQYDAIVNKDDSILYFVTGS